MPQDGRYSTVGCGEACADPPSLRSSRRRARAASRWALFPVLATVTAMVLAPAAAADSTEDLRSAIDAKRGNCPALEQDPILDGVAEQANVETQNYAQQIARFQPMEDPMPILQRLSYPAGKAKLLSGYSGPEHADPIGRAIYGATLFGFETIPDCTYTRYGAHAMTNAANGIATAAIVLAGD